MMKLKYALASVNVNSSLQSLPFAFADTFPDEEPSLAAIPKVLLAGAMSFNEKRCMSPPVVLQLTKPEQMTSLPILKTSIW